MSTMLFRNLPGKGPSLAIAAALALALCAAHVSSAPAQAVSYDPGTGVLQLNDSGSSYVEDLGSIQVYVASPSYLPSGGTINVLNGDWGAQVVSTTNSNNDITGDLMDWYYNPNKNDALPQGVYTLAQLPTGMSALDFGYSYSYTSGPQHTLHTINYGAGDTTGAVLFGSVLGGSPTGSIVNVVSSGPANLTWSGTNDNVWDVGVSANFAGSQTFNNGDYVTFDDSGSGGTVSIASGGVAPGSLIFANHGKSYTIDGGPITGSTSLVLSGGGTLVLDNSATNTFTGGIEVEDGVLTVAGANVAPAGTSLTVGAGGTFIFDPTAAGGPSTGLGAGAASPGGNIAAVPEPGTLALVAAVGVFIALAGLRRRKT